MQGKVQLTAVIAREGDGHVALCPELDIASQGDTVEEAKANLQEALEGFFETASAREIEDRLQREVVVVEPTANLSEAGWTISVGSFEGKGIIL